MEEHRDLELERAWPLFGLSVAHRDLLMREATTMTSWRWRESSKRASSKQVTSISCLAYCWAGQHPRRTSRGFLRYHWGRRSATAPEKWDLAFAVLLDGRVVGCQAVHTKEFPVLREVHTGSYLARHVQGRGVGTRMRAMVLELSFGHFGAEWATSGFVEGNERSRRVRLVLAMRLTGSSFSGAWGPGRPSSPPAPTEPQTLAREPAIVAG